MKMILVTNKYIWLCVCVCFCCACQGRTIDQTHILNDPCIAPCWQDIVPGKTNDTLVLGLLNTSDLVKHETIRSESDATGKIYFYELSTNDFGSVYANNENVVQRVSIQPRESLPIVDVLTRFGDPDFVYIENNAGDNCYEIHLFFLTDGIYLRAGGCIGYDEYFEAKGTTVQVHPNMDSYLVSFFEPDDENINAFPHLVEEINKHRQPWMGFGYYP